MAALPRVSESINIADWTPLITLEQGSCFVWEARNCVFSNQTAEAIELFVGSFFKPDGSAFEVFLVEVGPVRTLQPLKKNFTYTFTKIQSPAMPLFALNPASSTPQDGYSDSVLKIKTTPLGK